MKILVYLWSLFIQLRYSVPNGLLQTIALRESSWNVNLKYHPDAYSYGLMGLTWQSVSDIEKFHYGRDVGESRADKKLNASPVLESLSAFRQVQYAAIYLMKILPAQMRNVGTNPADVSDLAGSYHRGAFGYSKRDDETAIRSYLAFVDKNIDGFKKKNALYSFTLFSTLCAVFVLAYVAKNGTYLFQNPFKSKS